MQTLEHNQKKGVQISVNNKKGTPQCEIQPRYNKWGRKLHDVRSDEKRFGLVRTNISKCNLLEEHRDEVMLHDLYCIACDVAYNYKTEGYQHWIANPPTECPNCEEDRQFGLPCQCSQCPCLTLSDDPDEPLCSGCEEEIAGMNYSN